MTTFLKNQAMKKNALGFFIFKCPTIRPNEKYNYLQYKLDFLQLYKDVCHYGNGNISLLFQEQQYTL